MKSAPRNNRQRDLGKTRREQMESNREPIKRKEQPRNQA